MRKRATGYAKLGFRLPASGFRLHDARHACGTLMHMQGLPIVVMSQWLGHADPAVTMRTYVHGQTMILSWLPTHCSGHRRDTGALSRTL
jgi:integrase